MKMALGFNEKAAEAFLSPTKKSNGVSSGGASTSKDDIEEEIVYEDVEYLIDENGE
jgi:hypothetical protein